VATTHKEVTHNIVTKKIKKIKKYNIVTNALSWEPIKAQCVNKTEGKKRVI
jgi:hypothetical protein